MPSTQALQSLIAEVAAPLLKIAAALGYPREILMSPEALVGAVQSLVNAQREEGGEIPSAPTPPSPKDAARLEQLRATFTNEVIRAIGALARQQNVCREQAGKMVFVTGMEAAREYIVEHVQLAALAVPAATREEKKP